MSLVNPMWLLPPDLHFCTCFDTPIFSSNCESFETFCSFKNPENSFPDSWSHLKVSVDIHMICVKAQHIGKSGHRAVTLIWLYVLYKALDWLKLRKMIYALQIHTNWRIPLIKRIQNVGTARGLWVNWWWMFASQHEQTLISLLLVDTKITGWTLFTNNTDSYKLSFASWWPIIFFIV